MKHLLVSIVAVLALVGCGGGSGGGSNTTKTTYVGRVVDVATGAPISPAATVELPDASVTAATLADGSFTITVPQTSTSLKVVTTNGYGSWTFAFSPQIGTANLGDLWVGPVHVTLKGRTLDSTSGIPIGGAAISFGGAQTITQGDGTFSMDVAYATASQAAFWGISGSAIALNYYAQTFNAAPNTAAAGIVSIGDVLLTPSNSPNPPSLPYSITGRVLPLATSGGCVVTLSQSGTALRIYNVGSDGVYRFWIGPGTYSLSFVDGSLSAPTQSVTAPALGGTVTVPDVTLH